MGDIPALVAGTGVGVSFSLEKQLASLRHLFPAEKDTPTPSPANSGVNPQSKSTAKHAFFF
jgi:hypothetical protein